MARPELEFFLLSIVKDFRRPLSHFEIPRLGEHVNRQVPAFTREELIATLSDMFRAGDLIASRYTMASNGAWFVPAPDEIDAALCGALHLGYGLTPQGGARWEAMSEFDWNYHLGGDREDGFASASKEMIETYLSWTRRFGGFEVMPGTEQWSFHRPWKATYWKTLPEGIRIHYKESPHGQPLSVRYEIGDLWSREWNQHRHDEMRKYVPMARRRIAAVADKRWRIRLAEVAKRRLDQLPALLNAADPALQYAAGLRLAESGGYTSILLEWFLKYRRRYALRVVSSIHETQVLDALIEALKSKPLDSFSDPFAGQLGGAVAAYGESAVAKLEPLLKSESVEMQLEVLAILAGTGSEAAASLILDWLDTLKPDPRGGDNSHRVPQALKALAQLKDRRALPLLAQVIQREPEWVTEPLILFDIPESWSILESFIRSKASIHKRVVAARRMARANGAYQDEYERLRGKDDSKRLRILTRWITTGDFYTEIDEPIAALIGVLGNPDPELRVAAITLICRHDKPFPTADIATLLSDPVPEVRANAVYALGIRANTDALAVMEPLVEDPSGLVRYCAREALRRLRINCSTERLSFRCNC
jgi:hypothetical protein